MRRHLPLAVLFAALAVAACDRGAGSDHAPARKTREADQAPAPVRLTDLSTSLAEARATFNAHKGRPRFLTLLSPT